MAIAVQRPPEKRGRDWQDLVMTLSVVAVCLTAIVLLVWAAVSGRLF
jgi:hypothetical protein